MSVHVADPAVTAFKSDYRCEDLACKTTAGPCSNNDICQRPIRYNYKAKIPWPSEYPAVSTLHHDFPDMLAGPERLISHDKWVTQTGSVHDRKFYREERDFQPKHPLAPGSHLVHCIRPDFHRKMQGVASRNMKPYNPLPDRTSEMKDGHKAHYREADFYGPPRVFVTDHFVYLPQNRVNVLPAFTYDDMFSVLRKAHPYMSTYRINHKNFEDELKQHKFLNTMYNTKDTDVAIKIRTRPMLDPFEQTVAKAGQLPSLDYKREHPGEPRHYGHLKQFFRRPPYSGCAPRVHQPVPHVGMGTTYNEDYSRPLHPNLALNFTSDEQFCYIQPRESAVAVMQVPAMYKSEYKVYGSGDNVSRYVDCDAHKSLVQIAHEKYHGREETNSNGRRLCGRTRSNNNCNRTM